jgi:hypothetical protein
MNQIAYRKTFLGKPAVSRFRIGDNKGRKMQTRILFQHRVEFASERRIGGFE